MKPFLDRERHLPAIVIMTDGKSQGAMSTFGQAWRANGHRVPVFGSPSVTAPTAASSTTSPI